MEGYTVVVSLMETIGYLLNSSTGIWLAPASREILEFAYKKLEILQEISKRMFWNSNNSLDTETEEAALKIGGVLNQIMSGGGMIQSSSTDLEDLKQDVHSSIETLKKMEEEYIKEEEGNDDDVVSSRIGFCGNESKMVGLSDHYNKLKHILTDPVEDDKLKVVSLVGMGGIGKTTLAKEIFEDAAIVKHFDCRVWVTLGTKCQFKKIPRYILAQVDPNSDQFLAEGDDDIVHEYLEESLKGKRYLIVLDDVWSKYMAHHLQNSILDQRRDEWRLRCLYKKNGSRILLTSRLRQELSNAFTMRLLNEEESWVLLREKVFAKESCPFRLERAGKKIAEKCEGLPLTVVMVADLLSKEEKTPEYWSEVARQKNHQLFMAAYNEISKVLLPSYNYLPRILQMCFLYMGVFPQNYKIPRSKLINLWYVDGFLELNAHKSSNPSAIKCLQELVSNSLVMIYQRAMDRVQTKTYRLHSSLWHLAKTEAWKIKFFQVLTSRDDGLKEAVENQCRLSFHNNVVFGIKEVYQSVELNCASTTCSLLCYGPYHQYQVPICFGLVLLKVLDALTIRFYEFPMEVLQLVQLKYLAITLNGILPASISQLSNLQFLIVSRHMSIKFCKDPSYLPIEIWNMKQLKHLQVMGHDLPDPCGTFLESLLTLSDVSSHSCTEAILKAIPNLRKLGIRIEIAPDDDGNPLSCFNHISHLKKLRSFKCIVVNSKAIPPLAPLSIFPSNLQKLSLSGLGYSWEEMSKIASLPSLTVLKLRNYAFRGPKWEVEENGFPSLRAFVIDDTDLVEWKIERGSFRCLTYLSIRHCYKLQKIHGESKMLLDQIELTDCNPFSVEQMKRVVPLSWTNVGVHHSWDDGKLKT